MRKLEECKEEVFRRSETRMEKRRRNRKWITACCLPLCMLLAWGVLWMNLDEPADSSYNGVTSNMGTDGIFDVMGDGASGASNTQDFSFSLTWGCYGISSYDSTTGTLIKTTDATDVSAYTATYELTQQQKQTIYQWVRSVNLPDYPEQYNPHPQGDGSSPSMTLILTVRIGAYEKTVRAENIAMSFESEDGEGQKFLTLCKQIRDLLTDTEAWKNLPEYENFYD